MNTLPPRPVAFTDAGGADWTTTVEQAATELKYFYDKYGMPGADAAGVVDGPRLLGPLAVPFEEWLDGWLRAHPEVLTYDKEAMRDAFVAGRAFGVMVRQNDQQEN